MDKYNHKEIEPKWQTKWEEWQINKCDDSSKKDNVYILDMFPYPSGAGLHVGHPEGYTATDILARYKRMKGFNVLHPMGWDAFGLPAEQFAIETGRHPKEKTAENITTFKRQIQSLGFSYDWDREINTTDEAYFKWTQWIFLKLYERGLAYEAEVSVNWCEELGTVLANEEVIDGKSDRGGYSVIRKPMRQWMLKITAYADRLIDDLDALDWPESVKGMQRNWIGRSEGANVAFLVPSVNKSLTVFTTRPDTLFGATYMVIAPEHPFVNDITIDSMKQKIKDYQFNASKKSDLDRAELSKDKTGVFTGAFAVNPVNGKEIPIWISDYVLMSYGTGAIMAVPGHDERDYAFAQAFDLPIIEVVSGGDITKEAFTAIENGVMVNSSNPELNFSIDGLKPSIAIKTTIAWLEITGKGKGSINYKLRDWLFSRQRYWGEPIPILHGENGKDIAVSMDDLPLTLPVLEQIKPSGTGESPLANAHEWLKVVDPETGEVYRRETNTMPQWAGSCWYYLRFTDPRNNDRAWSKENEQYWMPVDLYIGGAEHAVLHLLYARFWHKFLYDIGEVHTKEPFQKLINQGMILGSDGEKMSKSKGNAINPDEVIMQYGADTMRLYEMFMGPLTKSKPWDTSGIEGVFRFLNRIWRHSITEDRLINIADIEASNDTLKIMHESIKKVTFDLDNYSFNTGISQLMVFHNHLRTLDKIPSSTFNVFIQLLSPFAPHLAAELYERNGHTNEISYVPWPAFDETYLKEDTLTIVMQVNGKVRAKCEVAKDYDKSELEKLALSNENIMTHTQGKTVRKVIIIPNKLVNIVAN